MEKIYYKQYKVRKTKICDKEKCETFQNDNNWQDIVNKNKSNVQ